MFFSGHEFSGRDTPETTLKDPAVMLSFWWWEKKPVFDSKDI